MVSRKFFPHHNINLTLLMGLVAFILSISAMFIYGFVYGEKTVSVNYVILWFVIWIWLNQIKIDGFFK